MRRESSKSSKTLKTAKSAKPAKKKTPAKKKEPKLKNDEVTELLEQVQAEEKSERTWKEMTSIEPDDADKLSEVEEKLLKKSHESNHKERGWKYFGK